ncbi:MAG TPA: hypothetical protein VJR89_33380 [Polyangiales bacterium]|nr:hypothetical protein [Polyangiales bacterium]
MNSRALRAWSAVLCVIAGCQANATPPSATESSVAPAAQPAPKQPAPVESEPAPPPAAGLDVESYAALVDVLLQRGLFQVNKDGAQAQFGKFASLHWKQPDLLVGEGPREELTLSFYGCAAGGGECIGSAELMLYADDEAEAVSAHRALEERLKAKLGKIKKRSNTDTSTPSLHWLNGRQTRILLEARPSSRRPDRQWLVSVNVQPLESP